MSTIPATARPELTALSAGQKRWVEAQLRRTRTVCAGCGGAEFVIGDALYVGFLFLSDSHDAYMVALSCTNPGCPAPRTGITLRASQ